MGKHTPGPWHVSEMTDSKWHVCETVDRRRHSHFASVDVGNAWAENDEGKANSILMAASPELLEQLEEADATICRLCKRLNPQHDHDGCLCVDKLTIDRLVSKAKGETP